MQRRLVFECSHAFSLRPSCHSSWRSRVEFAWYFQRTEGLLNVNESASTRPFQTLLGTTFHEYQTSWGRNSLLLVGIIIACKCNMDKKYFSSANLIIQTIQMQLSYVLMQETWLDIWQRMTRHSLDSSTFTLAFLKFLQAG